MSPSKEILVCKHLNIEQGAIRILRFADGEIGVEVLETIRGCDVFIVQSTCTPVNDHLMELLLIIDAVRRASPKVGVTRNH
jgi:ribose-phosphate pyrophosphokinase